MQVFLNGWIAVTHGCDHDDSDNEEIEPEHIGEELVNKVIRPLPVDQREF